MSHYARPRVDLLFVAALIAVAATLAAAVDLGLAGNSPAGLAGSLTEIPVVVRQYTGSSSMVDTVASSVYVLVAVGILGHVARELEPNLPSPSADLF
ncbi:hypothetical protein BRD00_13270 [Halobacteriales archaeon QS_8_69_26]|nr:MAG: hypothetical protein BRD00_13270 [Halobacteriales archaeon QS_8_69_26]